MPTIEAYGLGKSFRSQRLFGDLTFSVSQGDRLGVIGPSGIGKTTLLNILASFDRPDEGTLLAGGVNLSGSTDDVILSNYRLKLGFVPQEPLLISDITAYENIMLPYLVWRPPDGLKAALLGLARRFGIELALRKRAGLLSTGEKKRVELTRALLKNPAIIIADEPTSNLDEALAGVVTEVLQEASESGRVVVMSYHRDPRVDAIATSRINLLDHK